MIKRFDLFGDNEIAKTYEGVDPFNNGGDTDGVTWICGDFICYEGEWICIEEVCDATTPTTPPTTPTPVTAPPTTTVAPTEPTTTTPPINGIWQCTDYECREETCKQDCRTGNFKCDENGNLLIEYWNSDCTTYWVDTGPNPLICCDSACCEGCGEEPTTTTTPTPEPCICDAEAEKCMTASLEYVRFQFDPQGFRIVKQSSVTITSVTMNGVDRTDGFVVFERTANPETCKLSDGQLVEPDGTPITAYTHIPAVYSGGYSEVIAKLSNGKIISQKIKEDGNMQDNFNFGIAANSINPNAGEPSCNYILRGGHFGMGSATEIAYGVQGDTPIYSGTTASAPGYWAGAGSTYNFEDPIDYLRGLDLMFHANVVSNPEINSTFWAIVPSEGGCGAPATIPPTTTTSVTTTPPPEAPQMYINSNISSFNTIDCDNTEGSGHVISGYVQTPNFMTRRVFNPVFTDPPTVPVADIDYLEIVSIIPNVDIELTEFDGTPLAVGAKLTPVNDSTWAEGGWIRATSLKNIVCGDDYSAQVKLVFYFKNGAVSGEYTYTTRFYCNPESANC